MPKKRLISGTGIILESEVNKKAPEDIPGLFQTF
jgi:hypothetical protein